VKTLAFFYGENLMVKSEVPAESALAEKLRSLEELERRLLDKEKALAEKEEALRSNEDSGALRPVRPSEIVCVGEGFLFEVGPVKADSGLPTKEIACCDETEAIRWYVATTASPENPTKQVDPVKHQLRAVCNDPSRQDRRRRDLQLAAVRAKAERGNVLTPEEEQMLFQADLKRLQA
jgi:hypothetical protein